jgi:glycerophosphoryl diester phosphodiesterase
MFSSSLLSKPFLIIAHRGGAGLWPENTIHALQHAAQLGVNLSEIDLHMSRDGVLVVIHDETIERTTNGQGRVQDFTFAELKKFDAGYHWTADNGRTFPFRGQGITIPSLVEVFDAFPEQSFSLEIKQSTPPLLAALRDVIHKYAKTQRILVSAFNPRVMKVFRRLCPRVATAAHDDEMRQLTKMSRFYLENFLKLKADCLEVPESIVTPRLIHAAHKLGKRIDVWTVNETKAMQRLIDWGVDGILTDFPDRLLALRHADPPIQS